MQNFSPSSVVFEQDRKMFKLGLYGAFLPEKRDNNDFHCP
jgi:hypothetical protein